MQAIKQRLLVGPEMMDKLVMALIIFDGGLYIFVVFFLVEVSLARAAGH